MSTSESIMNVTGIQTFVEKVRQRTDALEQGDSDTANALEDDIEKAYLNIRARGRSGQEWLLPLLEDLDLNVRAAAAAYVLDFEPDRALPVLEEIAAIPQGRFAGTDAELTLDVWRSGKYKIA